MIEDWYRGRRVVVTGCHSGIGGALADMLVALDAEVIGLDFQPTERAEMTFHALDLRDPGSIAAAAAAIDGPIDALFNCAGVSQSVGLSPFDVMRVNFIGTRALTD
jgi:NAD(P)-dependent dehydrogenase (short-subunit alcohol dehydrogenase family)